MKKIVYCLLLCLSFLFLLCFPGNAVDAASYGLTLWFDTLVPTLFPIMILSNLLIGTNLAAGLSGVLAKPIYALLGISPYGGYAMIAGFFCGYPIGAKVLADLRGENLISKEEAVYLAPFCNNVSPAFLLNYLINQHLTHQPFFSGQYIAPTLVIVYGAPLLYGFFSNRWFRKHLAAPTEKYPLENKASFTAPNLAMIDACIVNGIQNITKLGGYVILFSVITAMTDLLPSNLEIPKACLSGVLEITTGIHKISQLNLSFPVIYLLLTAFTVFGGLCSAAQSDSMLKTIGISFRGYVKAKLTITAIALGLAGFYLLPILLRTPRLPLH